MAPTNFPGKEWFDEPWGFDCPGVFVKQALKPTPCRVSFVGTDFDGYLECKARIVLDSQQPRVVLSVADNLQALANGGHLVFAAQDYNFRMGIEKNGNAGLEEIRTLKSPQGQPQWFRDTKPETRSLCISSASSP